MPKTKRLSEGDDHKLQEAIRALDRSGAVKYLFNIRRRAPGQHTFPFWRRNIPVDDVPDIGELCYAEGGGEYEYRIEVRDSNGKPCGIPDAILPPIIQPAAVPVGSAPSVQLDPVTEALAQRQREITMQRQELLLAQQEANLARERRRLEKMRDGREDEEDEEDAPRYPYNPYMMPPYGAPGMMNPYMTPWWQQQQQQKPQQSDMAAFAQALATVMGPRREEKDSSIELLKLMIPLLAASGKGLEPKDMIGMFSPMVVEMSKASGEASRMVMQTLAESDATFREKMLDIIMSDPNREPDEIERMKRWLGFGTEAIREVTKTVIGRDTILSPKKDKVEVPKIPGTPKTPGLPSPTDASDAPKGEEKKVDPKEAAKAVVKQRIVAFVGGIEQESLIGSDVGAVVDQVEGLYLMLPGPLREKIEAASVGDAFEALREHAPEEVARILQSVAEDKDGNLRKWYEEFFDVLRDPGDEDEGGEGDEEVEPDPDPAPDEKVEA